MDLSYTEKESSFRLEAREWLEANVPSEPLPSGDTHEGFEKHIEWEKKLFDAQWAVVSWPKEYGGREASIWEWLIFEEEYYHAGAPSRVTQNGIFLLAPTIFEFGTKEQQDTILPRMAGAEDMWCQGWSEPGAGSDLASLRSKATKDEARGGWVINGQKTWTTRGAFSTHLFGLFRTDPEAKRHKGLTYLLVPLDADGVTVRGFDRLDGDLGFAEVFFENVFVPDSAVLGEVNNGWGVAMATTGSERGLSLRSPGRFIKAVDRLVELAQEHPERADDELVHRIAKIWMDAQAYQMLTLNQVSQLAGGGNPGARSSFNKILWSELDVRLHQAALDLLGPLSAVAEHWGKGFLFSLSGPIYAGTNEIQRNIVAERVLGLPRK